MSGPFIALNGKRIQSAKVSIPYWGIWCADVLLAQSDTVPVQSTLTIGDLTLAGSVFRMASFSGSRGIRLVGGAGGWRNTIPAQAYTNTNGVRLSMVLGDAAAAVGERINLAQDSTIGTLFVRENAPAQRVLRQLAGSLWWMDPTGVTQIGPRASSAIGSAFTVITWSGGKGMFEIATETLSDWMPARIFSAPTIPTPQTVGLTMIDVDNDGKLRLSVLGAGAGSQ